MLVLTRKKEQDIVIFDKANSGEILATVRVIDFGRGLSGKAMSVRIGIHAPGNIGVHRREIYEKVQCEIRGGGTQGEGLPLESGAVEPLPTAA